MVVCDLLTCRVIRDHRALWVVCDLRTYPVIRNYRAFWVVCDLLTSCNKRLQGFVGGV
jgi:hypothetical protein